MVAHTAEAVVMMEGVVGQVAGVVVGPLTARMVVHRVVVVLAVTRRRAVEAMARVSTKPLTQSSSTSSRTGSWIPIRVRASKRLRSLSLTPFRVLVG